MAEIIVAKETQVNVITVKEPEVTVLVSSGKGEKAIQEQLTLLL